MVIFLQYIKKKVMQNIQIFYGGPVMFVATCFICNLFNDTDNASNDQKI